MRVLVADDDGTSRRILAAILTRWGHEPVVVEDGVSALRTLEQPGAPQLVLLDWNMPGLEGPEVCRRLRMTAAASPPYVILLTARSAKGDLVRGLEAGANDYIVKPCDTAELEARLGVGLRMIELQDELVKARDALAHQATHDVLTSLPNRRAILSALEGELARSVREKVPLTIGMCDLDHFKKINDTWGHQAGDEVLAAFARTARSGLRAYDLIGRYGGEEFLVITPGTAEDGVYQRLVARVASTSVPVASEHVSCTVSIGVASTDGNGAAGSLLAAADAALYRAKAGGRNRVCYAAPARPAPSPAGALPATSSAPPPE